MLKVGDKVRVINKNFATFGVVGTVMPKVEIKTYETGTERIEHKIFNYDYIFKDNEDIEVQLGRSVDDMIIGTYYKCDLEVLEVR